MEHTPRRASWAWSSGIQFPPSFHILISNWMSCNLSQPSFSIGFSLSKSYWVRAMMSWSVSQGGRSEIGERKVSNRKWKDWTCEQNSGKQRYRGIKIVRGLTVIFSLGFLQKNFGFFSQISILLWADVSNFTHFFDLKSQTKMTIWSKGKDGYVQLRLRRSYFQAYKNAN